MQGVIRTSAAGFRRRDAISLKRLKPMLVPTQPAEALPRPPARGSPAGSTSHPRRRVSQRRPPAGTDSIPMWRPASRRPARRFSRRANGHCFRRGAPPPDLQHWRPRTPSVGGYRRRRTLAPCGPRHGAPTLPPSVSRTTERTWLSRPARWWHAVADPALCEDVGRSGRRFFRSRLQTARPRPWPPAPRSRPPAARPAWR